MLSSLCHRSGLALARCLGGLGGDRHDFAAHLQKGFRLTELFLVFLLQLLRQRCKVLIPQTADEKLTGHNIVDIAVPVPQGAVQGLALQLGFLPADQRHGDVLRPESHFEANIY